MQLLLSLFFVCVFVCNGGNKTADVEACDVNGDTRHEAMHAANVTDHSMLNLWWTESQPWAISEVVICTYHHVTCLLSSAACQDRTVGALFRVKRYSTCRLQSNKEI
jgi:hypothetical protein